MVKGPEDQQKAARIGTRRFEMESDPLVKLDVPAMLTHPDDLIVMAKKSLARSR